MKTKQTTIVKCHYCPKEIEVPTKEYKAALKKDPNKKYFCSGILCNVRNKVRE